VTRTVCATAPIRQGCDGSPILGTDFVVALLRSIATVAESVSDPAAFAAAITVEADALECRALGFLRTAAH
jgi:hypothetical protein